MTTSQGDLLRPFYKAPATGMAGNVVDDQGHIKGSIAVPVPLGAVGLLMDPIQISAKTMISPCFVIIPTAPPEKNAQGIKFFQLFDQEIGGIDGGYIRLWRDAVENRKSLRQEYAQPLFNALVKSGICNEADAAALQGYTSGGVLRKGLFGNLSPAAVGSSDYLDVSNLYSQSDKQTNVEQALLRLQKKNPMVHHYIVDLIGNRASKLKSQEAYQLGKEQAKVIKKAGEIVESTAKTAGDVAKAAGETIKTGAEGAATTLRYLPYILGGTLIVVGYLLWRNRETVGRAAAAYATGGTSEVARSLAK